MKKVRTIFIGTSDFAVPILESLINTDFLDIVAVVTQPDKPVGRRQVMTPPSVKRFLDKLNFNVPVDQPTSIRKSSEEILERYQPELIIVASYGQFISKRMLEYPKYKCLNVHASLLPELRGAVPIPMAILKGLKKTGISIQIMKKKMDAGELLAQLELDQNLFEINTESLTQKLSELAAEMMPEVLMKWVSGQIEPISQDESKATFCYMDDIAKEKAEITFETDIEHAERMVRAFYPWPVAWFWLEKNGEKKRVKVFEAAVAETSQIDWKDTGTQNLKLVADGRNLFLNLHDGLLELKDIQLEGKEKRRAVDYLYLCKE